MTDYSAFLREKIRIATFAGFDVPAEFERGEVS